MNRLPNSRGRQRGRSALTDLRARAAAGWLLDTNILSEMMRVPCDANVLHWIDTRPGQSLFTTAITVMEIRHGLARLPDGQRRAGLEWRFGRLLSERFTARVLAFDQAAGEQAGLLLAAREAIGKPAGVHDTMIAGIALANRMGIVTRNIGDFHGLDVPLVNPFDVQS